MLFPTLNAANLYISTTRNLCAAPNMAVVWQFLEFVLFWYVAQAFSG
jgi:hypothetical protein